MSRALPFTQGDVSRAIKAFQAARLPVSRVEIDRATGRIIIFAGEPEQERHNEGDGQPNPWDAVNAS